jgi:hypothetical protein
MADRAIASVNCCVVPKNVSAAWWAAIGFVLQKFSIGMGAAQRTPRLSYRPRALNIECVSRTIAAHPRLVF